MQLRVFDILPALQPYIRVICSMENDNPSTALPCFRVLPDTCTELFVNYIHSAPIRIDGQLVAGKGESFLVSRMNSFMDVQQPLKTGFVSVCFQPAAARNFFDLPMKELTNTVTVLQDLWKELATEMEDRIRAEKNNDRRVTILQQYLLQQLYRQKRTDKLVDYCIGQMNRQRGRLGIKELSQQTGISSRQLGRRFNDQIGLSPKEFARVTKFLHSLPVLKKYPSISLTEIAYECGYYDQAQFIHDYQEFSGHSPKRLLASTQTLY